MLALGEIVDDKFELIASFGMGAFGAVYKARQTAFDRIVALKFLQADVELEETVKARFEREARILSQLKHRNLALFYGYGYWENMPYMAMEFLEGRTLEAVVNETGTISLDRTLKIGQQICSALECVHANEVVHRDLKPANIVLTHSSEGETVKLIDFGLSQLSNRNVEQQRLTEAGCTVGTVEYMSPEQALGYLVDARSDIYAVGCVLFKCITGKPVFEAEHSVVVLQLHMAETPQRLADLVAPHPKLEAMQAILDKCLAKKPGDRYQAAAELETDLALLAAGQQPISAVDVALPQGNLQPVATTFASGCKRIKLAALCLLLICAAGAGWMFRALDKRPQAKSPTSLECYLQGDQYVQPVAGCIILLPPAVRAEVTRSMEAALKQNEKDHLLDDYQRIEAGKNLSVLYHLANQRVKAQEMAENTVEKIFARPEPRPDADYFTVEVLAETARTPGEVNRANEALKEMVRIFHHERKECTAQFIELCLYIGNRAIANRDLATAQGAANELKPLFTNENKQYQPPDWSKYRDRLATLQKDIDKAKAAALPK